MSLNNNDKLFELYQEKSKNFIRTFSLLLGIGIFFFFFIFIPYISILDKNRDTINELQMINNINNNITNFATNIKGFNNTLHNDTETIVKFYNNTGLTFLDNVKKCNNNQYAQRLFQTTNDEINNVTKNVKEARFFQLDVCYIVAKTMGKTITANNGTILSFYNTSFPVDQYTAYATFIPSSFKLNYSSPSLSKSEIALLEYYNAGSFHVGSPFWLYHNLKNKLDNLFYDHFEDVKLLRQNITKYNQTIGSNLSLFKKTSLERLYEIDQNLILLNNSLPTLKDNYLTRIDNAARMNAFNFNNISQTLTTEKFYNLFSDINFELNQYNPLFEKINNKSKLQLEHFDNITYSLHNKINQLEIKKNETSNRLKEIEFPFGKIPIGINESILFFPVGIGVGFLISASLLGDTIVLRKEYEKTIDVKKFNKKEIEQEISIKAPLWIEPHSSIIYQILKFLILLIPTILFGISVYLLLDYSKIMNNEDNLSGIFIGNNKDNEKLYNILYILSSLFILYGYWRIITEIRKYSL